MPQLLGKIDSSWAPEWQVAAQVETAAPWKLHGGSVTGHGFGAAGEGTDGRRASERKELPSMKLVTDFWSQHDPSVSEPFKVTTALTIS